MWFHKLLVFLPILTKVWGQSCYQLPNMVPTGDILENFSNVTDFDECCNRCQNVDDCTALILSKQSKDCQILIHTGTENAGDNIIGGLREAPTSPTTTPPTTPPTSTSTTTSTTPSTTTTLCVPGAAKPFLTDCKHYEKCVDSGWEWELLECHDDDLFDIKTSSCAPRCSAVCHDELLRPPLCPSESLTKPINVPHECDCRKFIICYNGTETSHLCPDEGHFDSESLQCKSFDSEVSCYSGATTLSPTTPESCPSRNSTRPHSAECLKYYNCSGNTMIAFSCDNGFLFDQVSLTCVHACDANCTEGSQMPPICPEINPTPLLVPDICDCRKFQLCYQGNAKEMSCAYDKQFDPTLQSCVPLNNSTCFPGSTLYPVTTTPAPNGCKNETYPLPHSGTCKHFINCTEDGIELEVECPEDSYFDSVNKTCVSICTVQCEAGTQKPSVCYGSGPGPIVLPDYCDCRKFFLCANGNGTQYPCPDGQLFNPELETCRSSDSENDCFPGATTPTPFLWSFFFR